MHTSAPQQTHARTCAPVPQTLALVGGEQLVDEVTALWAHVLLILRPRDGTVQDVVENLLWGVGVERGNACDGGGENGVGVHGQRVGCPGCVFGI